MGDTIHVDSVVDQGSDFWFVIPVTVYERCASASRLLDASNEDLCEGSNATSATSTARRTPRELTPSLEAADGEAQQHCAILIVDDNEINLRLCARMLERALDPALYTVKTATSGAQALELCAAEEFSLVFLDIIMPEMHGGECW